MHFKFPLTHKLKLWATSFRITAHVSICFDPISLWSFSRRIHNLSPPSMDKWGVQSHNNNKFLWLSQNQNGRGIGSTHEAPITLAYALSWLRSSYILFRKYLKEIFLASPVERKQKQQCPMQQISRLLNGTPAIFSRPWTSFCLKVSLLLENENAFSSASSQKIKVGGR